MDISQYAVGAEGIDALSRYQISNFFHRHKLVTKDECDRTAERITGSQVSPTLVQGEASYTVAADASRPPKVVQFRRSAFDLKIMNQALRSYEGFVPKCESHGMLADVHMYEMDCVPGVALSRARRQLFASGMEQHLLIIVQDFASMDKQAGSRTAIRHGSQVVRPLHLDSCDQLSQALPERFQPSLYEVRQGLPLLFGSEYPLVLNHDDLLEMNIHVDEETGHITGIVDWADAIFAPFGTSLWGLETLLGVQTSSAWLYHPNHSHLRAEFWKTFYDMIGPLSDDDRQAIEIGRKFGLFRSYGFDRRPERENAKPVDVGDYGSVCLETFCLP